MNKNIALGEPIIININANNMWLLKNCTLMSNFATLSISYLLTCACVGIHPGWVQPASPIALTTSRTEALQARRSRASSLDTFPQSCLRRAWPKTSGPEIGSRSALMVVAHVFSWPPARLRHARGGVGRRTSLISSPSGRLAAWANQQSLLCTSSAGMRAFHRYSFCSSWYSI